MFFLPGGCGGFSALHADIGGLTASKARCGSPYGHGVWPFWATSEGARPSGGGEGEMLVAIDIPGGDFVGQGLLVGDAAIQTLGRENAEFGFRHVEPAAMFGCVVPLCAAESYGGRSNDLTT